MIEFTENSGSSQVDPTTEGKRLKIFEPFSDDAGGIEELFPSPQWRDPKIGDYDTYAPKAYSQEEGLKKRDHALASEKSATSGRANLRPRIYNIVEEDSSGDEIEQDEYAAGPTTRAKSKAKIRKSKDRGGDTIDNCNVPVVSSVKKRKFVEDSADEIFDEEFDQNNVEDECKSRDERFDYKLGTNVGGKRLRHGREITLSCSKTRQSFGDKQRMDVSDDSSSFAPSVDDTILELDVSDDDFLPGPSNGRKTKFKKPEARQKIRQFIMNKRRKVNIEEDSDFQHDTAESKIQATELQDVLNFARESNGGYRCLKCGHHTRSRGDMKRHLESMLHQPKTYMCLPECHSTFTRKDSLKRHIESKHKSENIQIDDITKKAYKVQWKRNLDCNDEMKLSFLQVNSDPKSK